MSEISLPAALAFMRASVATQVDIAVRVRASQNRDYVLFDPDYHRVNREMINGYRVEVDTYGRHAVLNTASQKSLNFSQYFGLVSSLNKDIVSLDGKVYLKAISKTITRSNLPSE